MNKPLVAYFSASGVTARAAKALAQAVDGTLYEIKPATLYTSADLNWMDQNSRSSVEMKDRAFRPPLAHRDAPVVDSDTIVLGFPIWWGVAPTVVNTFLEAYDFSGKTIVLFATSGGSGMGRTADALAPSCPGAILKNGGLLNGRVSPEALKRWAEKL